MGKCFVINLEQAVERRKNISAQLDKLALDYEIFPAVDGRLLSQDELSKVYDQDKAIRISYHDLSPSEIGCALSHLGIYRKMVEDNISHALILEDDALVTDALPTALEALTQTVPATKSHIVIASYVKRYQSSRMRKLDNQFNLARIYYGIGGAHGYFLTQAAARAMLAANFPIWQVADKWEQILESKIAEVEALLPYTVKLTTEALNSSIQVISNLERKQRPTSYYLKKLFFRQFLHGLFVRPFLRIKRQPE